MASIDRRPNGKWRARYRLHPGGPQRAKHFDRKADAERFLTRVQSQLLEGAFVDPDAGKARLADYVAAWQQAQVHRPTTAAQVDAHLRNHILPTFGDRAVASIRPSEIQSWVRSCAQVLAPATVELVYRIFSGILADAAADRLIARNPAKGVRLPRKPKRPVEPPSLDRVEAVIEAMPDGYRALVVLAAGTSLRQGECLGLTVDRVDFLRRSITVDGQLVLAGSGPPVFGPPKTEASVRSVPLPDVVGEAIALHIERWPPGPSALLFTNGSGGPIRRNRFNEVWRSATQRAGAERLRFHDLRHFYASLFIRHGESVKVVQARLGHASASETLDTYAHLWRDNEERTRAAVDDVLGGHRVDEQGTG
jgi:integrase